MGYLLICFGLGMVWHGAQIIWVAGLPRVLRRGEVPTAEKGTAAAFGLFWLDQYSFIGVALALAGAGLTTWGLVL